jgi:hypothetical protein
VTIRGRSASAFAWTPERDEWFLNLIREHGPSYVVLASITGLRRSQLSNRAAYLNERFRAARAEWYAKQGKAAPAPRSLSGAALATVPPAYVPPALDAPPVPPPVSPPDDDPVEREQQRIERLAQLKDERDAMLAVAGERSLRTRLEALVRDVVTPFKPIQPAKIAASRLADVAVETPLQMFSDWHWGEIVDGERVRGHNAYNRTIADARVEHIVHSHLSIVHRMRRGGGWRNPKLVVGVNGDLLTGTIHELERHGDHRSIVEAVHSCGMKLAWAIGTLAAEYESVEVFCTAGNHGRLPDARRVQQKDPTRSWDTLAYLFAQTALSNSPHIRFFIPYSYAAMFEIGRWRFLQTHGHDIKSWNSIPWYGIARMVSNVNALEASRGTTPHYYLFAHFHQQTSLPHANGEMFVNGSLIGGNEFSVNGMGKADRPTQQLLMVHDGNGVTSRWPLFADQGTQRAVTV